MKPSIRRIVDDYGCRLCDDMSFRVVSFRGCPLGRTGIEVNPHAGGHRLTIAQNPRTRPTARISAKKVDGHVGWIVESPEGLILRKFVDTNDDNVVDQWSYYKDGVEVYRDIDSKFSGKADQFRWFNTGGTRWGCGQPMATGNSKRGRAISAEEVSVEIVGALANRDVERFTRVLLTPDELQIAWAGQSQGRRPGREDRQGRNRLQGVGRSEVAPGREASGSSSAAASREPCLPAPMAPRRIIEAYENVLGHRSGRREAQPDPHRHRGPGRHDLESDRRPSSLAVKARPQAAASGLFFQAASAASRSVASAGAPSEEDPESS